MDLHLQIYPKKFIFLYGLIDNLCHEIVYHKHEKLNYEVMTDICIDLILDIFK